MNAWGRVSQPTPGSSWDQEGLLSECLWGQSWRVVHHPESPGTRAWLCHPQSPALLESSPVTCWPVDVHTGSAWSPIPLPIILPVAQVLTLLPMIPHTVAVWLCYPQSSAALELGSVAQHSLQTQNLSALAPLQAWKPHYPVSGAPGLTTGVGAWVSGAPHFPCGLVGPVIEGTSGLDLSHPHLEKVRYLLQPLDWAQAAPPWGAWGRLAGGGWAVCPSVSTHHRAQSLFPRLKPSQLKSSKPRVVGATPPPVEERDRCSREGGRGGGPCKAYWRSMPHPGHAPAAPHHLPQARAHGQPEQDSEKIGGGQGRQKQPPW